MKKNLSVTLSQICTDSQRLKTFVITIHASETLAHHRNNSFVGFHADFGRDINLIPLTSLLDVSMGRIYNV